MRKLQSTASINIFEKSIDCIGTFVFNLISESGLGFYQRTFFQETKQCFKTKKLSFSQNYGGSGYTWNLYFESGICFCNS